MTMTKLVKNYYKYIRSFTNINISGPLFHTSRKDVVLPSMAQKENYTVEWLQFLRPAEMSVTGAKSLDGDPRIPGQKGQGIEPEVFEKWNRAPKISSSNDWSCCTWWDQAMR